MSQFLKIALDFTRAEKELVEIKEFLDRNATFQEWQITAELKKRPHVSCLIGSLIAGVPRPDVYKFEFQLLGVFRADLVVGSSREGRFVFVEFEGGEKTSLFDRGTIQMRDWSHQMEHGFGQLVDWAWAIQDGNNTRILRNAFGCDIAAAASVLVCGRKAYMDATEQSRFDWRTHNIRLGGMPSTCMTYDRLVSFFETTIEAIKSYH